MEKRPVREELWTSLDNMGEPLARAFRLLLEALVLAARPFSEMEVDAAQTVVQRRLVEVTVVVDPTTDVGIYHPGQIIKGRVGPVLETPSPDLSDECSIRSTRSKFYGGIGRMAEALDCDSSHESSILSSRPKWAVRIRGLPTACNRTMRVRVSHRPPKFGSGTRRQSAGLKSQWIRFNSVPSHHFGEWPSVVEGACLGR